MNDPAAAGEGTVMSKLTNFVMGLVTSKSAKRFEAATRDPGGAQLAKLQQLMSRNAGTEYGKKHGFGSIKTFEDYAKAVPITGYEDIKEDMKRVTEGASNVFTAEDPVLFAQTSGTTGDPKFIPVTPTCKGSDHSDVMRTWFWHARKAHPRIFTGKIISMVSPAVEGYAPSGTPFGSTSGQMYKTAPGILRRMYSIPYEIFEVTDYAAKYYSIMRIALGDDVHFMATANPSSVLKMCEKANEYADEIIKDIHDGTMSREFIIEDAIRKAVDPQLRADPARAKQLEQWREKRGGVLKPGDYWPNLDLIGCWKGGTVGHYLDKYPDWFDPDGRRPIPTRDMGYLSSEVLTVASNVFEFVEADQLESSPDDPSAWSFHTVAEMEEGREYYIFVSTTGGLYRYDINDVIKVTGRYNAAPQIVFLRKGRGMTNITGEKVSVNQVIDSIQGAANAVGVVADHFKAEADSENSRYVIRVEFSSAVPGDRQRAFLEAVDHGLKDINIEYKAKRDSQRLHPPVLHVMREGWYERARSAAVGGGGRQFQAKTEKLAPQRAATAAVQPELEAIVELEG
jgi:hypothetical protein